MKAVDGAHIVNQVMHSICRSLLQRADVDLDDYRQIGMLGYLKALRAFDSSKGEFIPYAKRRISGEILDWNRKLGARVKEKRVQIVYIEDLTGYQWLDMKKPSAEEMLSRKENIEWLQGLISTMRDSYQRALTHYYFEEKTLAEIGRLYGVTESRMSQILNGALRCLQQKMGEVEMPPRGSKGWTRDPVTKKWVKPDLSPASSDYMKAELESHTRTDETHEQPSVVDRPKPIQKPIQMLPKERKKELIFTTARQEVELVIKLKFIVEVIHQ